MCVHIILYTYVYTHTHINTNTHITCYVYVFVCVCVCVCLCVSVCVCVCVYIIVLHMSVCLWCIAQIVLLWVCFTHALQTKNEDDKMKWMATLVSLIESDLCLPNDMLVSIDNYVHFVITYVRTYTNAYHTYIYIYICFMYVCTYQSGLLIIRTPA